MQSKREWLKHGKRMLVFLLCFVLLAAGGLPVTVHAETTEKKVVRVGWYESSYCYRDRFGERRGIAYEYQRKISAHTGWTYEYVEDSWSNLLQMLIDGEIDLMSDVSFTEERAKLMLFPSLAMGSESYYVYCEVGNTEISAEDLQSFNGKKIGVNKGSIQEAMFREWVDRNHLTLKILPLSGLEESSMNMLADGEVDALVWPNSIGSHENLLPVCKIGTSDYFFAVNKERPELLVELNNALTAIQDEDPFVNQRLLDQYIKQTRTNAFLTPSLQNWLKEHGAIRVGYLGGYLPFCAKDPETGELTGALKNYLDSASDSLKNAGVSFETAAFPSLDAAITAMKSGEIDCVFPTNISTYTGEQMGLITVNPIMKTEMSVLIRADDRPESIHEKPFTVALDEGNLNFETYVRKAFPDWTIRKYPRAEDCYAAVSAKEADGVLVSAYHMRETEELRGQYRLVDLPLTETMEFSFAVPMNEPQLYSILNKIVNLLSNEDMEYALVSYMYLNQKVSFLDFLRDNLITVLLILFAIFLLIVVLILQKTKAQRKANEQQRLLEEASEVVKLKQTVSSLLDNMPGMNFTKDANTGVYLACNQAFAVYAQKSSPAEVIGKTDEELFEAELAERFSEDDRMALSMEGPYIFFEDRPDGEGNLRHIKTTKLKYTDDAGRLCVLGLAQDVTADTFRIRRDSAKTRDAYEKARSNGVIYAHLAQALAQGYTNLFYIDMNTEGFIEYRTDDSGSLCELRRGWHFFEQCMEDIDTLIYSEDRELLRGALDRKTLAANLERNSSFRITYRVNGEQGPAYADMKVTRMPDDDRFVVVGVSDIDEQIKQRRASERMQEERIAFNRLTALAGDYLAIFIVVPESGQYRELSSSAVFDAAGLPKTGPDFFADIRERCGTVLYPEDLHLFWSVMTRENVLADVEHHGIFTLSCRLLVHNEPHYVQVKAVLLEEKEGRRLIVGISDIDAQVRQEEEYARHLSQARLDANIDALTHVKNRHAYLAAEERLNDQLAENPAMEFAIVMLDVNDLKLVNDTAGHNAGDQYLRDACRIICHNFKHSPVFRVGGDEFAVISQGEDYADMDKLILQMRNHNEQALREGGIVIACGMSRQSGDVSAAKVLERADQNMYVNKLDLKKKKKKLGHSPAL